MKILETKILVADLIKGYKDSGEDGVVCYDAKLNARPPCQREFCYKDPQRRAVIRTITKGFPLNSMYWIRNAEGTYELLDGQQRSLSICQYVHGDFSYDGKIYQGLEPAEQKKILDYALNVYIISEGTDKERLEWFETINIGGEVLTPQELLNANYTGKWLMDAKRYFSKTGCAAYKLAHNYINGECIRQKYLETALAWISARDNTTIREYMAFHQCCEDASELRAYFEAVIDWVEKTFSYYRREMKGLPWGLYYNRHHAEVLDPDYLEKRVKELMADEDVTKKPGIYPYLLGEGERWLSIRAFDNAIKTTVYHKQNAKCARCGKECSPEEMEADHITPWSKGGHTVLANCQMLCRDCNRRKSAA